MFVPQHKQNFCTLLKASEKPLLFAQVILNISYKGMISNKRSQSEDRGTRSATLTASDFNQDFSEVNFCNWTDILHIPIIIS